MPMVAPTCDLQNKHCVPCEGGVPPLAESEYAPMLKDLRDWKVVDGVKLEKEFKKKNFQEALDFMNEIGKIAEEEGHHPDMSLFNWNHVKISLSTHAIKGLSENDFILASKIDLLR